MEMFPTWTMFAAGILAMTLTCICGLWLRAVTGWWISTSIAVNGVILTEIGLAVIYASGGTLQSDGELLMPPALWSVAMFIGGGFIEAIWGRRPVTGSK